ncbi:toll-like receptor 9 [Lycorma delicatula]|uniref:toll-like receptor 9 n=1 Tax=Lycorma delicatula TaxID=130591 RepID=UPI003F5188AF
MNRNEVNIALQLVIYLLILPLIASKNSEEYFTIILGSPSSTMKWIASYLGYLTFSEYNACNYNFLCDCLPLEEACLCNSTLYCIDHQNFTMCVERILNKSIPENQDTNEYSTSINSSILTSITEIWLGDNALDDVIEKKFSNILESVINITIYPDEHINTDNIVNVVLHAKNLISLSLVTVVSDKVSQHPKPSKSNKLKYITITGNYTNNSITHFQWIKNTSIKALNTRSLFLSDTELLSFLNSSIPETLTMIDFGQNLKYVANDLLKLLSKCSIRVLGLAGTNLDAIPEGLSYVSKTLQYLSLSNNNFQKQFSIASNNFKTEKINLSIFPDLPELLELDLRNCGLKFLPEGIFENIPKLKKLSIGHNNLLLDQYAFSNLNNLLFIDISLNYQHSSLLGSLKKATFTFKNYVQNPLYVDLSCSHFIFHHFLPKKTTHLFINQNFINLSQMLIDLSNLQVLYVNSMKVDPIIFAEHLKIIQNLNLLKELYLINIDLDDTFALHLQELHTLDLRENKVETLKKEQFYFLKSLELLDLSNNNIATWKNQVFDENKNLKSLNISFNKLTIITAEMINDFKNLRNLDISKNPLVCSHNLRQLICLSENKSSNFQLTLSRQILCFEEITGNILSYDQFKAKTECSRDTINSTNVPEIPITSSAEFLSFIPLIIIIVITTLISFVAIYYKWYAISYYITLIKFSRGAILFKKKTKTSLHEFYYDVFVSYSEHDRCWVVEQLLPQLETESGLHICLHDRDFQVGESIMENIMDNMNRSCCVLLVISNSFLKSRWCLFEMNLAQFYQTELKDHHIILVFLESIPKQNRPKLLHYLMSTKTYIEWPQESKNKFNEEKIKFFKRLSNALQHKHECNGT